MYEPAFSDFDSASLPKAPTSLPTGLAGMEPGPELGAILAGLDHETLTSPDRVKVIAACRRLVSHYQALFYREIWTLLGDQLEEAEVIAREIGIPAQHQEAAFLVTTEIGAALHLSPRAAQIEVNRGLAWSGLLWSSRPSSAARSTSPGPGC